MPGAVDDCANPVVRSHDVYFRFGVCESADAAADFSALVLFGLASTLPAAFAALVPVCLVLRLTIRTPRVLLMTTARRGRLLSLSKQRALPSEGGPVTAPSGCNRGALSFRDLRLKITV